MVQPSLRPQDVFVLAKLLSYKGRRPPMAQMSVDLSISSSEVHAALKRLVLARLVSGDAEGNRPLIEAVQEFLVHGVKYAFPAKRGEVTRGVPFPEGEHRGVTLEPLYKSAPAAALRDPFLYELLALIDALREGRVRERKLAEKELIARLRPSLHERSESQAT
ncbi:MAG: hypothetical protein AUF76_13450 [Acidobacteria bacterium 13_1_20CM_2_65_9]|nr:MAG: hypothetical protein AUF76_13450 [Acidobacteria bacterium 13_1_20CM_2_65_9]